VQVLEERQFPVEALIPAASERSLGRKVYFNSREIPVRKLEAAVFEGVDIALFSAGKTVSLEYAPKAVERGTVVIDNSSAWRMNPDIPLVVPEVNPNALKMHGGIIANPNCSTIQMVVALCPLHKGFGLKRVVVSTYQAVSGSGKRAIDQLEDEINSGPSKKPYYPHPIAFNCLPHIDVFNSNGYTQEEMKMMLETRKILDLPDLPVTATTVRVPVRTGHSESVNVEFEKAFEMSRVFKILRNAPGIIVQDNPEKNEYPMPILAQESDAVFVGRIRRDESIENGLNLWIVSDNLRKGAATNAVQIAELLIGKNDF
jgi:aspartate-semialdehyde dehydrogenase